MMSEDALLTDEPADDELPAPRSATSHVARFGEVPPRPHEEQSDSGAPHPSHRAS